MVEFHFFCIYLSRCPNTICWRGHVYSILCFFPLCWILIDHRDLGLFMGFLFCSIGLCACFYASTRRFWLPWLVIQFDIRYCDPSYFVVLSQNCCSYLSYLCFHINFWSVCSISVKYVMGTLIGIALNL